jgi:folate-dependent tRNA-U54 methylase TrmFO/GidA
MPLPFLFLENRNMEKTWLELKYGRPSSALTILHMDNRQVLTSFKSTALELATENALTSKAIDPVVGLLDHLELRKLQAILDLLIPANESHSGDLLTVDRLTGRQDPKERVEVHYTITGQHYPLSSPWPYWHQR